MKPHDRDGIFLPSKESGMRGYMLMGWILATTGVLAIVATMVIARLSESRRERVDTSQVQE